MAVLNFTGREAIDRGLIEIACEKDVRPLKIYLKTKPELKENPKFAGCDVVLDAYLRTKAERAELGHLSDLAQSVEVVFKEFASGEDVQFRLKVVNPFDKKIAGIVIGLEIKEPKKPKDDFRKRKSILPVNWARDGDDLKNRFWKISFDGVKPTLLIRKGKFTTLGDVNRPEFQALAFPDILREVLTFAFVIRFDSPPSWAADWERFVEIIDGTPRPELSPSEKNRSALQDYFKDTVKWIDAVSEKFAASCGLDGIDSNFKKGGSHA